MHTDAAAAYGTAHLTAIAVLAAGVVAILAFTRWAPRRSDRVFAIVIVAFTLPMQVILLTPTAWDRQTSLPLNLCDWAWAVAALALWTRSRLAATMTYLWGLTLATQAIFTPTYTTPFPAMRWWLFWGMHLLIVWAAVYVVWAMKLYPTWHTYWQTVAITLSWAVGTFAFNLMAGTNYGYLNAKPPQVTALELLGPWPIYVLCEIVIVLAAWGAVTWPWTRRAPSQPLILP